jgi:hypothetical protein
MNAVQGCWAAAQYVPAVTGTSSIERAPLRRFRWITSALTQMRHGTSTGFKERASRIIVTSRNNVASTPAGWDDVQVGDNVQLTRNGRIEYTGQVDDRTADGDVVWIKTGLGRRLLFHVGDGFQLAGSSM